MLVNILKEQIHIFEYLIALEKEKRQNILRAKGLPLESLLHKSEQSMLKLEKLDRARIKESRRFLVMEEEVGPPPTLREILKYSQENNSKQSQELEKLTEKYRRLSSQLKDEVQANQELLRHTRQRIQDLFQNLQAEEQSLLNKAYGPPKQKSSTLNQAAVGARLLNTGA